MNRKEFIKTCGWACLGIPAAGMLLQSCQSSKRITAALEGEELVLPLSAFEYKRGGQKKYRKYLLVQQGQLQFPICVFRMSQETYSAVWMKCSHQGAELQVFGEKLQCPAHGSEFDRFGKVENRPADKNLRTFPVYAENNQLKIVLK